MPGSQQPVALPFLEGASFPPAVCRVAGVPLVLPAFWKNVGSLVLFLAVAAFPGKWSLWLPEFPLPVTVAFPKDFALPVHHFLVS